VPGGVALITVLALLAAGCSREQQDWRSAKPRHQRGLRTLRRAASRQRSRRPGPRPLAQLAEERDWTQAGKIATCGTPIGGSWPSTRAADGPMRRACRIEAFSLGSSPRLAPLDLDTGTVRGGAAQGSPRAYALQLSTPTGDGATHPVHESSAPPAVPRLTRAEPTEAAPARVSAARPAAIRTACSWVRSGGEASADREWRRLQGIAQGRVPAPHQPRGPAADRRDRRLCRPQRSAVTGRRAARQSAPGAAAIRGPRRFAPERTQLHAVRIGPLGGRR